MSRFIGVLRQGMRKGKPQPATTADLVLPLVAPLLPRDPVIIEAGAHVGNDTVRLAEKFPLGTIHAFEPLPSAFVQLEQKTARCPNVRRYTSALSDVEGVASFHVSSGGSDGSSSLLQPKEHLTQHPEVLFTRIVQVETITLDGWAERSGVRKADFLWLDLQGGEFAALNGARQLLPTVQAIFTEVSLIEQYEGTVVYPAFRAWLEGRGFRLLKEVQMWPDAGNVLFARS